jgi:pyridoxal phosphate enzyme (YggS family)
MFMDIATRIKIIKDTLPANVKLVAVTKTKPSSLIMEAYESGHKIFGENKAQELSSKYASLPKDIEWHMIGHLQTNKVKYIASFVSLIHSVDSMILLNTVDKEAAKHKRIIPCLLQVKIAKEETKFGLAPEEIWKILESDEFSEMKNIKIVGVMGMATFTENTETVRTEFITCRQVFENIKTRFFQNSGDFKEISMGMSDDYLIAIEEGATMVRIGSSIFGERQKA